MYLECFTFCRLGRENYVQVLKFGRFIGCLDSNITIKPEEIYDTFDHRATPYPADGGARNSTYLVFWHADLGQLRTLPKRGSGTQHHGGGGCGRRFDSPDTG